MMETTKTVASMLLKSSPPRAQLKTRILATELMKKRAEAKSKLKKNLMLNSADFQIIGSDNQPFSPSLLVSSEGNSYLFNCGEGMQRFCYTSKVKLLDLENIFITNHDWSRVAGAYGLSLTLQDIGAPKICVHSTDGIEGLFDAGKNFIQFTTGMKCTTESANSGKFQDSGIEIIPVILDKSTPSTSSSSTNQSRVHSRIGEGSDSQEFKQVSKKAKCNSKLIAYICSLPDLPGALNPEKCRELNVPIGRHLATLKSGQDVELPDGRLILSSDVCGPKSAGLKFIVIECPTIDKINYLFSNTILEQTRRIRKSSQEKQIDLVVHFTPKTVLHDPRYRQWMQGFADDCKHLLISNDGPSRVNFIDSYRMQYLLQKLDCEIFPSLYMPEDCLQRVEAEFKQPIEERCEKLHHEEDDFEESLSFRQLSDKNFLDGPNNIIEASSLDKFGIRPHKVVESVDPAIHLDLLYEEARVDSEFESNLKNLRELQKDLPKPKDHEPELIFLGTGSALPSKLRNVTCILLNFQHPKEISVMMDCGEDSYGQLYRHYGPDKTKKILKQLKMIYVSHQHADHHIGLTQLLRKRREVTCEPVCIILPPHCDSIINYHNENFEDLSDSYEIYSTYQMKTKPASQDSRSPTSDLIKSELRKRFGGFLDDITIVKVNHCANSCAVVMRFNIGHPEMKTFTVAYSGDARPSEDFVYAGRGCDLLIHEATFDHRSDEDALQKKHCTSTEAIGVARKMEAKFTILTHFSQRLAKIPYFTEDFDDKIGFSFDNLALRCPTHFCRLPIMKSLLNNVFKKSISEIDMRYHKQQAKQQMINDMLQSRQQ